MKTSHSMLACALLLLTSGCASVMNDSSQAIRLDTLDGSGKPVAGAECTLSNDYGPVTVRSGATAQVHRSSQDLELSCKAPAQPDASGRAISRANAGLAGNIIFGGGIGAIIDHSKGTAYTYPTWVQLEFGKTLVFDRRNENEGQPVRGTAPAPATTAGGRPTQTAQ